MAEVRAGGYVDKGDGKGWVVDDSPPKPPPESVPHKPLQPVIKKAAGWALTPDSEPEPEPEPASKKTAAKKAAKKVSKSKGDDG